METHYLCFVPTGTKWDPLTLSHQSAQSPKGSSLCTFCLPGLPSATSPYQPLSIANPTAHDAHGLFLLPVLFLHGVSSGHCVGIPSGQAGTAPTTLSTGWPILIVPKAVSTNPDGSIFFLTRNLNISRRQGCPVIIRFIYPQETGKPPLLPSQASLASLSTISLNILKPQTNSK